MANIEKVIDAYGKDNLSESVINSKDLLDYLDTVEFLTRIFKKVQNDVSNLDSNTLYEVYYHAYKLQLILEDSSIDTLVRKQAKDLLNQLEMITDLVDEEKTHKIYSDRKNKVKVDKQDKIKYSHSSGYDGLVSKEITKISGDFKKIFKNMFIRAIKLLWILLVVYLMCRAVPVVTSNIAELLSVSIKATGEDLALETTKANPEMLNKFLNVIQTIVALLMNIIVIFQLMTIGISLLYINLRINLPWDKETREKVKNSNSGLENSFKSYMLYLEKFVGSEVINDCDNFIKHVRIKKRIHIEDRIERNNMLLKELLSIEPNNQIANDIRNNLPVYGYKDKYRALAKVEYLYDRAIRNK